MKHRAAVHWATRNYSGIDFFLGARWKALDEIYKIYMLLHRSDLNILAKKTSNFFAFFRQILQILIIFIEFCSDFDENFSEFRQIFVENVEHSWNFWISDEF